MNWRGWVGFGRKAELRSWHGSRCGRRAQFESLEERQMLSVSPEEQLFIYMLNRARSNPAAYATEQGLGIDLSSVAARPPLAINDLLMNSAEGHAVEMANNNYFAHQSAVTGKWPNRMERDAGYALPTTLPAAGGGNWVLPDASNQVESLAAGTYANYASGIAPLNALLVDSGYSPPAHREHLLASDSQGFNALFKEVGVGHAYNAASDYDHYWSIQTGVVNTSDEFLTGVVFNDTNSNQRYDQGEGLSGVTITVGAQTTTTNAAGGWSFKVANGTYTVQASGGGFSGTARVTTIASGNNVEVDFISGRTGGYVNFSYVAPASREDLVVDFGSAGLWNFRNNTAWQLIHSLNPSKTVVADMDGNGVSDLVVDFGSIEGLWILYNGTNWQKIHPYTTNRIVTGDLDGDGRDEAIVDFGGSVGTWAYTSNTNSWRILTYTHSEQLVVADLDGSGRKDIVADLGSGGIYVYWNNTSWQFLHSYNPVRMTAAKLDANASADLVVDFGGSVGTFIWMNAANWQLLHSYTTTDIVVGDLNGDTRDDLIVNFGSTVGIWRWYSSTASWSNLTFTQTQAMVTGDLDGNGTDEIVADLGAQGIYVYWNNTNWVFLHSYNPEQLAMAQFDAAGSGYTSGVSGASTRSAATTNDQALLALLALDGVSSTDSDDSLVGVDSLSSSSVFGSGSKSGQRARVL